MKIIAANFKMNGNTQFIRNWFSNFNTDTENLVVVGLPAIYLENSVRNFNTSNLKIAAQNVSKFNIPGAYTGQISPAMLKDVGVEFCIIGHSEARDYFSEDNESIYEKYNCLKSVNIKSIVCIGESLEVREAKNQLNFISDQIEKFKTMEDEIIFAYEPIWAIGTGLVPTQDQIEEMSCHIKSHFSQKISVLYGGSVNSNNSSEILNMKNIDGVLVGGASLNAEEFANIAQS
ncbi:MAG: triose-phosphate isomerase [SAR86 cluster bacterium]|uniref:Triosephosphate isomerase n=1 Tax=SAR86 cluster bacterium TaxID=2030880 RepID=A0A937LL39_9GAMM|nr:triose-phosphate isomerase [SAR86 cluster bacterium]